MRVGTILIVGSIALDTIETPHAKRDNLVGGSTTYATIAAGHFSSVHVVGVVGRDFPVEGFHIYENFAKDLTDLKIEEGKTFRWGGRYAPNMDDRETLFTDLGVFESFAPQLSPTNRSMDYVFLANIHPALQQSIINQIDAKTKVIVDTMNLWIDIARPELLKIVERADILIINDSEARLLSGCGSLDECAVWLMNKVPDTLVIKKGSQGALMFKDKEKISISSYPVKNVMDSTGAGDTFGGCFSSILARGGSLLEALVTASALASVCVEGFGVEALLKTSEEEIRRREDFLRTTLKFT